MNALVTGGLGFLGRSLCTRLIEAGHRVTILDNLSNAVVAADHFGDRAHFVMRDLESCSLADLGRTDSPDFDNVFHLASPVGPVAILEHAGLLAKRIVDETCAILDIAVACHTKLLFISSSEVYGRPGRQREDLTCEIPSENSVRLEYGLGKRLAETVVENRMTAASLPFTIIRPFNMAGPYQRKKGGFVIPTFVAQALAGEPLTVFGDGTQRRAFGHVDDIARGIAFAADADTPRSVYNLGCPENTVTIAELAKLVVARCKSDSPITFVDPKTIHGSNYAEAFDKQPDIDRARRDLGWSPRADLGAVLDDVISFRREGQLLGATNQQATSLDR